jgi:L-seryl-tRNA(Ser) seleniumtransferase
MNIYETLGIRPVINAQATLTRLGGSLMPPEVLAAMADAARSFISLDELQLRVGDRIAELTQNEAAYVSSGAAAGLLLATAACITGLDPDLIFTFPDLDRLKNEVIVHKSHRNGYDYAVRQVGAKIIEIGELEKTTRANFERAITPKTAAFFWFQGAMNQPGDLPFSEVIDVAKAHNIPVVVDAAAQLPPASNLWKFTQAGADLAIFSGGKDLRGPQSTGLVLGRRDLIDACRMHGNPNHSIGRPMKVGKEEMAGILAAVERYVNLDPTVFENYCENTVTLWCDSFNAVSGLSAQRSFPNEAGQPFPRCHIEVDSKQVGMNRDALVEALANGTPPIMVQPDGDFGLYLNPMTLEAGEEKIVLDRLLEILMS